MKIIDRVDKIDNGLKNCCLTIGNFDGVHLGHQKIIESAKAISKTLNNCPIAVMTFDPHPAMILHPNETLRVLTPLHIKTALLEKYGVDYLIVFKDNYKVLTLSPQDFISDFIMKEISPQALIEGDDFHFGYGRSGNIDTLRELGQQHNFSVTIIESQNISVDNEKVRVSSTVIRRLLHKGDVADASRALGRPYRLIGNIIHGRGKGAEIGFPTANIDPHDQIIPAEGVYAGFVSLADSIEQISAANQKLPAVFSLGRAKTFVTNHPLLIEAHILDKNIGSIYDKFLAMDFVGFIRTQFRFESEAKLVEQIAKDCRKAENILQP